MSGMLTIYVLKLTQGKFYVGQTDDLKTRVKQHCGLLPGGAKWTKLFPPVKLLCYYSVYYTQADYEEKRLTQNLAEIFGPENVKGGDWAHPTIHMPYHTTFGHSRKGEKQADPKDPSEVLSRLNNKELPRPLSSIVLQGESPTEVRLLLEQAGCCLCRDEYRNNDWFIVSLKKQSI